ncbi:MAG: YggS family pyridoxal phosphate-dependent enzyme [Bacteroides sp.]|nr:YggS family pyridoxal phosphate-dependent enzyme [Lachnospiraceae bacterium]MCM1332145.1 YggS family pyridoxal phosphate-dependent enzyme [Bacteroides sp.]MCM1390792.1 YggS family pyridoxal phosphate-dependent enzyme [Bacteroides sp.]
MSTIGKRINGIKASLPKGVTLVAVSKFHPVEALMEAYDCGQRVFGESRANELVAKASALPHDVEWHFIGHLQTNKVRTIIPHVSLIHSIDSEKLLKLVDSEAKRIGRSVDVLLQVHVAKEETKFGFSPEELDLLATSGILPTLSNVRVRGVMGMASNVDDEIRIRQDFHDIARAFENLHKTTGIETLDTISMGMSHDYITAIEEGSNMVRIGTTIFGEREY